MFKCFNQLKILKSSWFKICYFKGSPNAIDKNKNTGLHHACLFGFVDIVKILIDHPDIDLVTIYI